MYTCMNQHDGAMRLLLDAGAMVNWIDNDQTTALMCAGENGHANAVRILLEAGAVVDSKDKHGWSALVWAGEGGHEDALRLLLEAGAAVDADALNGSTALMHAGANGHAGSVRVLLGAKAAVDWKDTTGKTALMCAAENGHADAIGLLLEAGAAVDSKDNDGMTAMAWASAKSHASAVLLLLEAEVGLNREAAAVAAADALLAEEEAEKSAAESRQAKAKRKKQRQKTKRAKAAPAPAQAGVGASSGPAPSCADPPSQCSDSQAATAVATGADVEAAQRAAAAEGLERALRVGEGGVWAAAGRRASQAPGGAGEQGGAKERHAAVEASLDPPPVVAIPAEEVLRALEAAGSDGEVGEGGFGKVFAAELPSLATRWGRVAVKYASGAHAADILKEVETLRLSTHRNVLPLLGYCDDARAPCMITPLMHGGSLDDRLLLSDNAFERLRRLGFGGDACLDWQRRLSALCDAARGLAHLHSERILHRDVKTANILLDGALRPLSMANGGTLLVYGAVLSDVGLAKVREPTLGGGGTTHATTRNLAFSMGFGDPAPRAPQLEPSLGEEGRLRHRYLHLDEPNERARGQTDERPRGRRLRGD